MLRNTCWIDFLCLFRSFQPKTLFLTLSYAYRFLESTASHSVAWCSQCASGPVPYHWQENHGNHGVLFLVNLTSVFQLRKKTETKASPKSEIFLKSTRKTMKEFTVAKNWEASVISSCLQANNLASQFHGCQQKTEMPGSEVKDFTAHIRASSMSSQWPGPPCPSSLTRVTEWPRQRLHVQ